MTISLDNYVSDPDNTDAEMTWTYSSNDELIVSIVDRVATITVPNLDWNGVETITFNVSDPDGLWDEDAAVFTVNGVNDPPIITTVDDTTAVENQLYSADYESTDVDGGVPSWSVITNTSFLLMDANTGVLLQEMHQTGMLNKPLQRLEGVSINESRSALAPVAEANWKLDLVTKFVILAEILPLRKSFTLDPSLRIDLPDEAISIVGAGSIEKNPDMI